MSRLRPEHLIPGAPVVAINRAITVMDQGIKVHFLAIADAPSGCWQICGLERYIYQDPALQLWVTVRPLKQKMTIHRQARWKKNMEPPHFMKDFLKNVLKVLPKDIHVAFTKLVERYFLMPEERFEVDAPGPPVALLWDRELPAITGFRILPHGDLADVNDPKMGRGVFTTYAALDRIFMFKPKRIRILCCDMMGSWVEGKSEEECNQVELEKKTTVPLDRWKHERYHLKQLVEIGVEKFRTQIEWISP